jgi:hypothetical protein
MDKPRSRRASCTVGGTSGSEKLDNLLWVYGSLMSVDSVLATLAPRRVVPHIEPLTVSGWRRTWNCLSAKTFQDTTGRRVRRVVLGLEPEQAEQTRGVLLQLDEDDMAKIRARERAYDEVDITAHVERPPGRVVTFVPRSDRNRHLVAADLPLVVERAYYVTCRTGAQEHGLTDALRELEVTCDLELVDAASDIRYSPPEPSEDSQMTTGMSRSVRRWYRA